MLGLQLIYVGKRGPRHFTECSNCKDRIQTMLWQTKRHGIYCKYSEESCHIWIKMLWKTATKLQNIYIYIYMYICLSESSSVQVTDVTCFKEIWNCQQQKTACYSAMVFQKYISCQSDLNPVSHSSCWWYNIQGEEYSTLLKMIRYAQGQCFTNFQATQLHKFQFIFLFFIYRGYHWTLKLAQALHCCYRSNITDITTVSDTMVTNGLIPLNSSPIGQNGCNFTDGVLQMHFHE